MTAQPSVQRGLEVGIAYRAEAVIQRYGGIHALNNVDFLIRKGEVHALLGANGAGKSSLVKVLGGYLTPTSGALVMDGEEVAFADAGHAASRGVVTVSQELITFPNLSVMENLFVPDEPTRWGVSNRRLMKQAAILALDRVDLRVPLDKPAGELRLGERQLLEIARALVRNPKILILDEPTSALNAIDTTRLLGIIRELRQDGVGIVYVSHFLQDVLDVADVVTILREGVTVMSRRPVHEVNPGSIVKAMTGDVTDNAIVAPAERQPSTGKASAQLVVREVEVPFRLKPLSFTAGAGEVVGLAGSDGSGVAAVLEVLFGRTAVSAGEVILPCGESPGRSPRTAVRRGVAFVPADRKRLGLMAHAPVWENIALARVASGGNPGVIIRPGTLRKKAERWKRELGIKMASPSIAATGLSGGNQQKVVFAKWLETNPSLLLLEDPTRGVDVVARVQMHSLIRDAANAGRAVVMYSSDHEELIGLCERVLVFYRGQVVDELAGERLTEENLMMLTTLGTLQE